MSEPFLRVSVLPEVHYKKARNLLVREVGTEPCERTVRLLVAGLLGDVPLDYCLGDPSDFLERFTKEDVDWTDLAGGFQQIILAGCCQFDFEQTWLEELMTGNYRALRPLANSGGDGNVLLEILRKMVGHDKSSLCPAYYPFNIPGADESISMIFPRDICRIRHLRGLFDTSNPILHPEFMTLDQLLEAIDDTEDCYLICRIV